MDSFVELIQNLNNLTPLAVTALALIILGLQIQNKNKMLKIETNDLHELPQVSEDIRLMLQAIQRMEVQMSREFSYLRARLNGGRNSDADV